MAKIQLLEESVINQIAAGEVVERPASVVKELVENSIDAGASIISIEVEKGGKNLIKVTDNGAGMDEEDAKLCVLKHATSKIKTFNDLSSLNSLGFRGEALSSISAVSFFELRSKTEEATYGTEIINEAGELKKCNPVGCPIGTSIVVRNLFFNLPARRKFVKSDATEYGHILKIVSDFAIAYPKIYFKLISNGKTVLDLPSTASLLERITFVLGKDFGAALVAVFCEHKDLKIEGFVGRPEAAKSTKNGQYLFINGRGISNAYIAHAVSHGYSSYLPEKNYPIFVLKLQINPELADFNIHPRKLEVKFVNQSEVYFLVKESVKKALESKSLVGSMFRDQGTGSSVKMEDYQGESSSGLSRGEFIREVKTGKPKLQTDIYQHKRPSYDEVQESLEFNAALGEVVKDFARISDRPKSGLRPLTQVAQSYLVCENEEGLVIIDQHAAHERIMFMRLKENFAKSQKSIQKLLTPVILELSFQEAGIMRENQGIFENLGFEVESFGGNTFSIFAIPAFLVNENVGEIIKGTLSDMQEEKPLTQVNQKLDRILEYMACRSAVKFGNRLSKEEQEELVTQLQESEMKYTCPHGRPTMLKFSFSELARKFGRK